MTELIQPQILYCWHMLMQKWEIKAVLKAYTVGGLNNRYFLKL